MTMTTYTINTTDQTDQPPTWLALCDAVTPAAQDSGRCRYTATTAKPDALEAALEADESVIEYAQRTIEIKASRRERSAQEMTTGAPPKALGSDIRARAKAPKMAQGPWLPIKDAPKDGTVVDLWLKEPWNERKADMVWYEPWEVWVPKTEVEFIDDKTDMFGFIDDTDMFGTGSEVPTHFMLPPKGPVL